MKSEKEKLAAKTVDQLKAAVKRLGGKLVTPDGKAKTKQQLINTIVMKKRLAGVGMGAKQTGTSNKAKDLQRKAKAPGKRTSAKGKEIKPAVNRWQIALLCIKTLFRQSLVRHCFPMEQQHKSDLF